MKRKRAEKNKILMEKFSLKHEYWEVFGFLKSIKFQLIFVICLFFLVALIVYSGIQSQELNDALWGYLKKIASQFEGKSLIETILMIFSNNLAVSFLGLISGIFFCIIPIIIILSNAYAIGFVAQKSIDVAGIAVLWKLLPHGIFELPAVFISLALGIKLGSFVFAVNPWKILKEYFAKSMKVFFYIIIPLLAVAAIIESSLILLIG